VHLIFEFAEQQGIHLKNWTLTIFDYTVNLVNGRTIIVVIERVALERHKLSSSELRQSHFCVFIG
jgi:hypothetical protein